MKHKIKDLTLPHFYNSPEYQVSYLRMYKSGSSTICKALEPYNQIYEPEFKKKFTCIRNPFTRAKSIYRQMRAIGKEEGEYSFEKFLEKLLHTGFYDKHQISQSFFLRGNLKLFRLEDEALWCEYIGISPGELVNQNVRAKEPHNMDMSKKSFELVERLYSDDIDLWMKL